MIKGILVSWSQEFMGSTSWGVDKCTAAQYMNLLSLPGITINFAYNCTSEILLRFCAGGKAGQLAGQIEEMNRREAVAMSNVKHSR